MSELEDLEALVSQDREIDPTNKYQLAALRRIAAGVSPWPRRRKGNALTAGCADARRADAGLRKF